MRVEIVATLFPYNYLMVIPPKIVLDCFHDLKLFQNVYAILILLQIIIFLNFPLKLFQNVYAIGDCCNTPEEKMAAFCTAHAETVAWNIWKSMKNQEKIAYKQRK